MDSIKTNLKFWLAGLIAGVILVERWRRYGGRNIPAQASTVSADKPKVSKSIVTGAKADAERVRRLLERTTPPSSETVGSQPSTP